MANDAAVGALNVESLEHPALVAWHKVALRVRLGCGRPGKITVLKDRGHSMVYRLAGAGPGGKAVIAKECRLAAAVKERTIYQDILPKLGLPFLDFYGYIRDDEAVEDERCWSFMEDAGDEQYSILSAEHRALAGRSLAILHSGAASLPAVACLPPRGADYYLQKLQFLVDSIQQSFANYFLDDDARKTLSSIRRYCDVLESHWNEIARLCERMPQTLVHGDLAPKNIRLRRSQAGDRLVILDWETAGWGVPAVDLAPFSAGSLSPGLIAYMSAIQPAFANAAVVAQMANLGRIFRLIVAMHWEKDSLTSPWPERAMRHIKSYEPTLADSVRALGWGRDVA